MDSTNLPLALEVASLGFPVFPVRANVKAPRIEGWQQKATTDPAWIAATWRRWPRARVGIATGAGSGLIVLDVDPRHGGDSTLKELENQHGPLPVTLIVRTPSGGWHLYLRHPGGHIPNTASKLGPGLDTRGDGGFVVVYERPTGPELADAPAWFIDALTAEPAYADAPGAGDDEDATVKGSDLLGWAVAKIEAAEEGTRNTTLNGVGYYVGKRLDVAGLDLEVAIRALGEAGIRAGLEPSESYATARSGLTAGLGARRAFCARVDADLDWAASFRIEGTRRAASIRATLLALLIVVRRAGQYEVSASSRQLAVEAGIGRKAVLPALNALQAVGLIFQVEPAEGTRAPVWKVELPDVQKGTTTTKGESEEDLEVSTTPEAIGQKRTQPTTGSSGPLLRVALGHDVFFGRALREVAIPHPVAWCETIGKPLNDCLTDPDHGDRPTHFRTDHETRSEAGVFPGGGRITWADGTASPLDVRPHYGPERTKYWRSGLGPNTLFVWIAVQRGAGTAAEVSAQLGLSPSTVRRVLQVLALAGLIAPLPSKVGGGLRSGFRRYSYVALRAADWPIEDIPDVLDGIAGHLQMDGAAGDRSARYHEEQERWRRRQAEPPYPDPDLMDPALMGAVA